MKATFKVGDTFRLKEDHTFTRGFRIGGFNEDGSVAEIDKEHRKAGSTVRVSEVYEVLVGRSETSYQVDFGGDSRSILKEAKLLELFDPI